MILPSAPEQYSRSDQERTRSMINLADLQNIKRGQDIELSGERLIIASDNGNRWALVVSNAGVLGVVAV